MLDLQALCDASPVNRGLEVIMTRTEAGVTLQAQLGPEHLSGAPAEVVHGGIIGTLLDTAATFALIAHAARDWSTIDLRVDYLRPVRMGRITVAGDVLRAGRSIGRARASLTDGEGKLCAVAIGSFAPGAEMTVAQTAREGADR